MKFGTFHLMERPFWKSEPQVVAEHLDQMRAADELGFDAVWLTVFVGETDEAAQRDGREAVEYYMKSTALFRPIGAHERDEMIFGSPDTCAARLERLAQASGVNYILCWMNFGGMPQERVIGSMKLFAHQVLPRFR